MDKKNCLGDWQEAFVKWEYDAPDYSTQCKAGWYDWFCEDRELANRLKEMGEYVGGKK